jgi:hypothetical protein
MTNEVDFLIFQSLHEALSKRIVVRITLAAHTDLNTNILQIICLSRLKSLKQSIQCELSIDIATEIPTNATPAENIYHHGQKYELLRQLDICDIP